MSEYKEILKQFPEKDMPIRTALVTARNAPAHERVIRTLRAWDVRIDEAFFLGGIQKGGGKADQGGAQAPVEVCSG